MGGEISQFHNTPDPEFAPRIADFQVDWHIFWLYLSCAYNSTIVVKQCPSHDALQLCMLIIMNLHGAYRLVGIRHSATNCVAIAAAIKILWLRQSHPPSLARLMARPHQALTHRSVLAVSSDLHVVILAIEL